VLKLGESGAMGIPMERRDFGRLDVDRLRCGAEIYPVRTRDETVGECGSSEEGVGDASVLPENGRAHSRRLGGAFLVFAFIPL
jgi:hypothetical protein